MSFNEDIVDEALATLRHTKALKQANEAALNDEAIHPGTRTQCEQAIEAANRKSFAAKVVIADQLRILKIDLQDAEEEYLMFEGSDLELYQSIEHMKVLLHLTEKQRDHAAA